MGQEFEQIMEGLHEGMTVARREEAGTIVHHIEVPVFDVAKIRAQTGLSQAEFAKSIGVAKGTLLNWQHGRRRPTGPAQVLLAMIARRPSVVAELLRAA